MADRKKRGARGGSASPSGAQRSGRDQRPQGSGDRSARRKGAAAGGPRPTRPRPADRAAERGPRAASREAAEGRPRGRDALPGRLAGSVIEGRRAAAEALRSGFPVKRALVAEGAGGDAALAPIIADLRAAGARVQTVPRSQLDALSAHGAHQGIVLETGSFPYADLADVIARAGDGPALVLVLDHVTDAGNFGAIVRSAEVVGAAGVVIASKRAAEVTVATYKTSAGAVMHLPIAQVPNIARALDDLKDAGFWVCGASEHAEQVCWDAPLSGRLALVMGSEGEGISRLVLEKCDFLTKLPQRGLTESLNVAQAATALAFEWMRRNREALTAPVSDQVGV